jgi:hypothetical protein
MPDIIGNKNIDKSPKAQSLALSAYSLSGIRCDKGLLWIF